MLLRSTLFGWCFLDYWAAGHGRVAGNADNGVLLQVPAWLLLNRSPLTKRLEEPQSFVALLLMSRQRFMRPNF